MVRRRPMMSNNNAVMFPKKFELAINDVIQSTYKQGTFLSGEVTIVNSEPMDIVAIRLSFIGTAHVSLTFGDSSEQKADEQREFMRHSVTIWGNPPDAPPTSTTPVLPAGRHFFKFAFPIPKYLESREAATIDGGGGIVLPLPGTLKGRDGRIEFSAAAYLDRPTTTGAFRQEQAFRVEMPVVDLNYDREANVRAQSNTGEFDVGRAVCCCGRGGGKIRLGLHVPKSGYVAGELIAVRADVINKSGTWIDYICLKLIRTITFRAQNSAMDSTTIVAETSRGGRLSDEESERWANEGLLVPADLEPTIPPKTCHLISIRYDLYLEVTPGGIPYPKPFDISVPINIGHVPLVDAPILPPLTPPPPSKKMQASKIATTSKSKSKTTSKSFKVPPSSESSSKSLRKPPPKSSSSKKEQPKSAKKHTSIAVKKK